MTENFAELSSRPYSPFIMSDSVLCIQLLLWMDCQRDGDSLGTSSYSSAIMEFNFKFSKPTFQSENEENILKNI